MPLFDLLPSIITGGASLLGGAISGGAQKDAAAAAAQALLLPNVSLAGVGSTGGTGGNQSFDLQSDIDPALLEFLGLLANQSISDFGSFDQGQRSNAFLDLLRLQALPEEQARRSSLESRLFNSGRLGVGVGGGLLNELRQRAGQTGQTTAPNLVAGNGVSGGLGGGVDPGGFGGPDGEEPPLVTGNVAPQTGTSELVAPPGFVQDASGRFRPTQEARERAEIAFRLGEPLPPGFTVDFVRDGGS